MISRRDFLKVAGATAFAVAAAGMMTGCSVEVSSNIPDYVPASDAVIKKLAKVEQTKTFDETIFMPVVNANNDDWAFNEVKLSYKRNGNFIAVNVDSEKKAYNGAASTVGVGKFYLKQGETVQAPLNTKAFGVTTNESYEYYLDKGIDATYGKGYGAMGCPYTNNSKKTVVGFIATNAEAELYYVQDVKLGETPYTKVVKLVIPAVETSADSAAQ